MAKLAYWLLVDLGMVYSPPLWFCVFTKIPIHPKFDLLKGDYICTGGNLATSQTLPNSGKYTLLGIRSAARFSVPTQGLYRGLRVEGYDKKLRR